MRDAEDFVRDLCFPSRRRTTPEIVNLIRARDAEVWVDERAKALAEIKGKALDHRKFITEGPLVARLLVSHWCNEALLNPTEGETDDPA